MRSAHVHVRELPWISAESIFEAVLRDERWAFWLDDQSDQGWSYLGSTEPLPEGASGALPEIAPAAAEAAPSRAAVDAGSTGIPFRLGWVGWLGYEGQQRFARVRALLALDHSSSRLWLLHWADDSDSEQLAAQWRARLGATANEAVANEAVGKATAPAVSTGATAEATAAEEGSAAARRGGIRVQWRHGDERYLELIAECQEAIARGDAYQLCLTNTATIRADATIDPVAAYLRLRAAAPSHHGALIRQGERALLSASPEQFLAVSAGGGLRTRPIKGTRPRSADAAQDAALAQQLRESVKERAENVMIVDLVRNDLSRVAELGSVEVTALLEVEHYPAVHQLVSTVEAQLRSGLTSADAVRSLFPAGSMTGTPKASAIRLLAALEQGPRGVYSGCFGWFGSDGAADLGMVIRSIVFDGEAVSIGAGGGITALSVPAEELAEVQLKAQALLAVLGAQEAQ